MTAKQGGIAVLLLVAQFGLIGQVHGQLASFDAYRTKALTAYDDCKGLQTREIEERLQGYVPDPAQKDIVPDCIAAAKAEASATHAALQKGPGKAPAKQAARALHASVLMALDGIPPTPGERRGEYTQRQAAARMRMAEAWATLQAAQ